MGHGNTCLKYPPFLIFEEIKTQRPLQEISDIATAKHRR